MEKAIKAIKRFYQMHELLVQESTGNPEEFAKCLQISRRQLYKLIQYVNGTGCSIQYSRTRKTFFYTSKDVPDIVSMLKRGFPEM